MVFTNYQNFVFSQSVNFQVTNKYGEWLAIMLCYWFDNYGTSILFEIVMDEARATRSKRCLILKKKKKEKKNGIRTQVEICCRSEVDPSNLFDVCISYGPGTFALQCKTINGNLFEVRREVWF